MAPSHFSMGTYAFYVIIVIPPDGEESVHTLSIVLLPLRCTGFPGFASILHILFYDYVQDQWLPEMHRCKSARHPKFQIVANTLPSSIQDRNKCRQGGYLSRTHDEVEGRRDNYYLRRLPQHHTLTLPPPKSPLLIILVVPPATILISRGVLLPCRHGIHGVS